MRATIAPTTWRIVLVVEDDSDGRAYRELARAMKLRLVVDWLPVNGIGNIKRSARGLIERSVVCNSRLGRSRRVVRERRGDIAVAKGSPVCCDPQEREDLPSEG